jgi:hypothetical protein
MLPTGTSEPSSIKSLILCPDCKVEMRLLGIEPETDIRDLYTFQCDKCARLEVRGVVAS